MFIQNLTNSDIVFRKPHAVKKFFKIVRINVKPKIRHKVRSKNPNLLPKKYQLCFFQIKFIQQRKKIKYNLIKTLKKNLKSLVGVLLKLKYVQLKILAFFESALLHDHGKC